LNPDEIQRRKRQSDQVFRSIKRYTYKTTKQDVNDLIQESTIGGKKGGPSSFGGSLGGNSKMESIDDDDSKNFTKQIKEDIKKEQKALLLMAQEIKDKTFKTPQNLFFHPLGSGLPSITNRG
jgi:hypothetical protein